MKLYLFSGTNRFSSIFVRRQLLYAKRDSASPHRILKLFNCPVGRSQSIVGVA